MKIEFSNAESHWLATRSIEICRGFPHTWDRIECTVGELITGLKEIAEPDLQILDIKSDGQKIIQDIIDELRDLDSDEEISFLTHN